ncbi:MAG TPA: universal stress protein [Stellaceae bacterium]|nr:universal stress protein [Stellaceae bacterium]
MKRILVGDDGSNAAHVAIEQASELAAKTGAELIALAVFEKGGVGARDIEAFARSEDIDVVEAETVLIKNANAVLDRCRNIADRWGVIGYRQECLEAGRHGSSHHWGRTPPRRRSDRRRHRRSLRPARSAARQRVA